MQKISNWFRMTAAVLAAVMLVQTVPVRAAAFAREPEINETAPVRMETEMIQLEPVMTEPAEPDVAEPAAEPVEDWVPETTSPPQLPEETLTWTVENGVLTISGTGDMPDWAYREAVPWEEYAAGITAVVVEEGVTSVGSYAFDDYGLLEHVTLADSVQKIGACAFLRCGALKELILPEGLVYIYGNAFSGCSALENLVLPDTVTYAADRAFQGCSALRDVTLSAGLREIAYELFRDCTALETVRIPEGVTYLGNSAFRGCKALREVVLPETLTSIEGYAFYQCEALEEVTIPGSVRKIRSYAFQYCTGLEDVAFSEGLTTIEQYAFSQCSALGVVKLPDTVTSVGAYAFQYCSGLREAELSGSLTKIDTQTFGYCDALERITIPESVTYVATGAFSNCLSLDTIEIPQTVTYLGNYVFSGCKALVDVSLPEGLTTISSGMFSGCTALEEIHIPSGVTLIDGNAFDGCTALKTVNLPAGLKVIGHYAFSQCEMLTGLQIPDSLTDVGNYAFRNCRALTGMSFSGDLNGIGKNAFAGCTELESVTFGGTLGTLGESAFSGCGKLLRMDLPEGLTAIGKSAFSNCTAMETVTMSDSVTSIGDDAFRRCTALREIVLSRNVTSIGKQAFMECSALTELALPQMLTGISDGLCRGCTALERVTMPEKPASIGGFAFYGCAALREVDLPDSVTTLGSEVFAGCRALERAALPAGLTSLGYKCFDGCSALREIALPNTVTAIGEYCFNDCTSLEKAVLSEAMGEIPLNAFRGCAALAQIEVPDSVTRIGRCAFEGCAALKRAVLGSGLAEISAGTFRGCAALQTLVLPEGLAVIGDSSFESCTSLEEVSLPDTVVEMGSNAFCGCTALRELKVSHGLTEIAYNAFSGCESLEILEIPDSVTAIYGSAFSGCRALTRAYILENVTYIDYGAFSDCENLTIYTHRDAYVWDYAVANQIPVVDMEAMVDLTMTVLDEAGNVLTEGITVEWYRSGSEELLAAGPVLRGVDKNDCAYDYRIVLDEAQSCRYHQPERTAAAPADGNYDLTHTLIAISQVTLTGRVEDSAGMPVPGAQITLRQHYHGSSEKLLSAVTDQEGAFAIRADGVSGELEVRAEGYYTRNLTAELTQKSGTHQMEIITLTALPAQCIELAVWMTAVHEPGTAGLKTAVPDPDALQYTIYNVTQSRAVTAFAVQNSRLFLGDGEALPGDTLRITAADRAGGMSTAAAAVTLDENRTGSAELVFEQNGVFRLEELRGGGEYGMMLFHEQGALVDEAGVDSGYTSRNLPAGSYELVLLEKNSLLRSVARLEQLEQLGLREQIDYLRLTVTVTEGLITSVEPVTVPALDESRLCYVDQAKTILHLSRQVTYPEQLITLRLRYAVDSRYTSSRETIRIQLPDGVSVGSGVYLDGGSVPYSVENGIVLIPTGVSSGDLAMYLITDRVGEYSIPAQIEFQIDGARVLQPLGSGDISTVLGTMEVPARTATRSVAVSGVTMPHRIVHVQVNGEQVGTTRSNAVGSWKLSVPLDRSYRYSVYQVRAKIQGAQEGTWFTAEPEYVVYDSYQPEVTHMYMYNEIHYGISQTTYFNFVHNSRPEYYRVKNEGPSTFTFRVYFSEGDDSTIRNVCVVTQDGYGDNYRIRCRYDQTLGCWYGCYTISEPEYAPEAFGVTYEVCQEPGEPIIDSEQADDLAREILDIMEKTDRELGEITYVDDGTFARMDLEGLLEQADADLSTMELLIDDFDDAYQAGMSQMELLPKENGGISTAALGGIQVDHETIELESVDEEALLAEGYEKIGASNGSCLYYKQEGSKITYVDPVNLVMTIITQRQTARSAAPYALDEPDIFGKIADAISTQADILGHLETLIDMAEAVTGDLEQKCKGLLMKAYNKKATIYAAFGYAKEKFQERVAAGADQAELTRLRQRLSDLERRMDKAAKGIADQAEKLKIVRGLKALFKALPIVGMLYNLRFLKQTNENLRNLRAKLPAECPADPAGLQKIRSEIDALAGFMYFKIILDFASDIGAVVTMVAGVIGTPFTGGLSVLAGAVILGAALAQDYLTEKYVDVKYNEILDMLEALQCDKPKPPERKMPDKMLSTDVILDPSGYVYEAVPSNRIEGVKTELYYKDGDTDVLWNAGDYDQVNPCYTDALGEYHWDVPWGQWLVKYSKEGYWDTDSRSDPAADAEGYLPVPPPQMEVNTAIVSRAAPTVESVRFYEDELLLIFSQYMKPDTVSGQTVKVLCGDREIGCSFSASNAEWNYEQTEQFASVFRLTPEQPLTGSAELIVSGAVNYAGTAMAEEFRTSGAAGLRPERILVSDELTMGCGTEYRLEVQLLPAEAGAGKTIEVWSSAPELLGIAESSVTADENGKAQVTLRSGLPGTAAAFFRVAGTDLRADTAVTIDLSEGTQEICAGVTASIPNGAEVAPGTELTLSTETEGAQIYYTLDGTCPCVEDSPSRILYTGPVTLTEDTFLIAYAVKAGAQDSPTAGFLYRICRHGNTRVDDALEPGCVTEGYTGDVVCADCGTLLEQGSSIGPLGHRWDEGTVTREPTEDTEGERRFSCTVCGETRTEPIPVIGHEHRYEAAVTPPTCTEEGFTTHTCRCGERYTDDHTPALGHAFSDWTVVREPSPVEEGLEERTCVRCACIEQRPVARLENPFTDVPEGSFYYEPVMWAVARGITNGATPTTFNPGGSCLRAHVVTFLHRAAGNPEPTSDRNPFTDVRTGDFFYKPVLWAVEKGITNGVSATEFGSVAVCNRAAVVTFLWRAAGSPEPRSAANPFEDVRTTDFFYKSVLWAVEEGITNGVDATHFGPAAACNRAQVVTFLYRVWN